jgi:hypothetical protein
MLHNAQGILRGNLSSFPLIFQLLKLAERHSFYNMHSPEEAEAEQLLIDDNLTNGEDSQAVKRFLAKLESKRPYRSMMLWVNGVLCIIITILLFVTIRNTRSREICPSEVLYSKFLSDLSSRN